MDTAYAAIALLGMVVIASIAFVLGRRETRPPDSGRTVALAGIGVEEWPIEGLLSTVAEFSSSLDLASVMDKALVLGRRLTGADRADILLAAPDDSPLRHAAWLGSEGMIPPEGRPSPFRRGEGLAGWVMEHRQPVAITDLRSDSRWIPLSDRAHTAQSALAVPLVVGDRVLGAMILLSRRTAAFDESQVRLVAAIAQHVAAAMNNAELYRLIHDQAEQLSASLHRQQVEASKSRAILEAIAEGVLVTDGAHQVALLNPAAERILGVQREQVLGRPATSLIGMFGRSAREWAQAVQAWAEANGRPSGPASLSQRIQLEDGRVVSVQVTPIRGENGFLGTVSSFRDITREVEVDRLKSEFVATVSHELRTPMTSIRGYAEILLMNAVGQLNEEQRRYVEVIRTNTERLASLVAELLDLSRIEAGRAVLSPQPLSAAELLDEARSYALARCQQENKPLDVLVKPVGDLPVVSGDSERMRQVFENLIDNAVEFTRAGGSLELAAQAVGDQIEFTVKDSGIGIPAAEIDRVFERFFRGERALELGVPGTGLGLAIVRSLVQMQGGQIGVSSSGVPGQGTTFSFTLPLYAARIPVGQAE
ncbi:MAG: ATP-binding protein [Anaerolineales bacterium]|nr:ATP-binding protein [Anaerolineales bacterium]